MTEFPSKSPTDDPPGAAQTPGRSPSGSGLDRGERVASAALGGTLLTLGLGRRSLGGAATAIAGGYLLYRGISGRGRRSRPSDATTAAGRERREAGPSGDATAVERSITVGKPADELDEFWREPERLARVVGRFAEVTAAGEDRQRWTVRGPLGRSTTWETKLVEDRPGERLRWETVAGTGLLDEGSVRFRPAPGDRGTEVTLRFRVDPPGGALGDAALKRLGVAPGALANKALRRFKSLAETGEIPTLDRNPSARGRGDLL